MGFSTPDRIAAARRGRALSRVAVRPRVHGKFLYVGDEKLLVRGVTYGPFRPDATGSEYHDAAAVERDLAAIASNGLNAIRTYTVPPRWFLDAAQGFGLRVLAGLPWAQPVAFLGDKKTAGIIERCVREGVRACAGHPAILCYAIGNEIPGPIVRWHGPAAVERYIERLHRAARAEDPGGLFAYVNYPTTEYLRLPFLELVCFNIYLESQERLEAYLARLHNLAGEVVKAGQVGFQSLLRLEIDVEADELQEGKPQVLCGRVVHVREKTAGILSPRGSVKPLDVSLHRSGAVPAHDGGRDLVTDRVAEDGRVTGASPHALSDAALDDPGRFLVAQEGDVLRPRQPDHDPKAEPLGSVEKPAWRNRVGTNRVQAVGRDCRQVPLHGRGVVVLTTRPVGPEGAVGHAPDQELLVADVKKLAMHTGPDCDTR